MDRVSTIRALLGVVEARLGAEADDHEQWVQIARRLEEAARIARRAAKAREKRS